MMGGHDAVEGVRDKISVANINMNASKIINFYRTKLELKEQLATPWTLRYDFCKTV